MRRSILTLGRASERVETIGDDNEDSRVGLFRPFVMVGGEGGYRKRRVFR